MHLPHARDAERRRQHSLPHSAAFGGLDVDDDVALGQRPVERGLDRVGSGVSLPHGCGRGDADDHVDEVPARRLAQAQASQLDRRVERGDRGPCCRGRACGGAVHEHVDVALHQPAGRDQDEGGHEERCNRVAAGVAGARREQAEQDGDGAGQVGGEVERVGLQRSAVVPAPDAQRDGGAGGVEGDHETEHGERVRRHLHVRVARPREPRDGEVGDAEARDHEERRLCQGREVLGLPVSVLVGAVGRPDGDADREERQQRGDEVGARVQGFGDEAEAVRGQADHELDHDERGRDPHRDEGCPPLR